MTADDIKYQSSKINIAKGLYVGEGVNMRTGGDVEDVYIPWKVLNSHLMCFGTTQMGKTRMLIHSAKQIMAKGDDLMIVDPKGAIGQELHSWVVSYASAVDRMRDYVYLSPFHKRNSVRINMLYGMGDEEITSAIIGAIDADEAFYLDIANEILMSVLPALSFLEKRMDTYVVEIMERIEYSKALVEESYNRLNKYVYQEYFDTKKHGTKAAILKEFIAEAEGDKDKIQRISFSYKEVMRRYKGEEDSFPIRKFVTFADLAPYATQDRIKKLYEVVTSELALAVKEQSSPEDVVRLGYQCQRELKKVADRDSAYFSKVTSTYATTMTKLSTGDVGDILCDSRINIVRDRMFLKDSGLILFVQPFPMKYQLAANMLVKMLVAMMNSIVANVGSSGVGTPRRVWVQIDEAGSIINRITQELANKGGGLGLSLLLYSQSFQDYVQALGMEGAAILADNSNTKMFYKVNDEKSAETVSAIMGSKKKGDVSYASSDARDTRATSKSSEEALVPSHVVSQMPPQRYLLKVDAEVYVMKAPFQADPLIQIVPFSDDLVAHASKYQNLSLNRKTGMKYL